MKVGRPYKPAVPGTARLIRQYDAILRCEDRSLKEIARASGVGAQTLSTWRRGNGAKPTDPTVFKFACALEALGYELVIRVRE